MKIIPFFDKIVRTFRWTEHTKNSSDRLKAPRPRRLHLEPLEDRTLLAVCFVDANATGTGNGLSWNAAFKTLQEALDYAALPTSQNITEIWVAEGTYTPSKRPILSNDPRSVTFSLVNGVSIYGGFAGWELDKNDRVKNQHTGEYIHQTILSGDLGRNDNFSNLDTIRDNAYTVLYGSNLAAPITIEGLTITGGNAQSYYSGGATAGWESGGGIVLFGCANVTLDQLNVTGNNAGYGGGGISINGGTTTIISSSITGNFANSYGGGVHFVSGNLTVQGSVIADNVANGGGGGLHQVGGTLTVSASHFSGNTGMFGGGLLQDNGTGTITTSSFISNVAPDRYSTQGQGGGICQFGEMNISETTFANNVAGRGGGIFFSNNADGQSSKSPSNYTNLTVSQNVARSLGGGIYVVSGLLNLNTSIVAANTAPISNTAPNGPDIYGELAESGGAKNTLVLCGGNNVIGIGAGIPAVPTGPGSPSFATGKTTIANNDSQKNQVGTLNQRLDPRVGAPTDSGKGIFVLPLLTGSPALNRGIKIGAFDAPITSPLAQTYVVYSLENKISTENEPLTFRAAFEAANRNIQVGNAPAGSFTQTDIIRFAPGLTGTIYLNGQALTIYGGLEIQGWTEPLSANISSPGAMNYLTIDAGYQSSIVKVIGSINVSLSEITLQNGYSSVNGGGMVAYSSNVTLNKVAIRDSISTGQEGGGGFYSRNVTLDATNIIVSGCTAAVSGGGMLLNTTNATIVGASVYQNKAGQEGGGLFMISPNGTSLISNATFAQNRASHGAGLAFLETTVRLVHLTVTKNVGDYIGGIMVGALARVGMNNSIVADNFSYISPDIEVYNGENNFNNADLRGSYNLLGNNTGLRNGLTLDSTNNLTGTAASPINPRFLGPSYYNGQMIYPLADHSPAVDAGSNTLSVGKNNTVLTYDVRGVGYARFVSPAGGGNRVDMGACEYQANLVGSIYASQGVTVRHGGELDFEGRVVTGSTLGQRFLWDFNNNGIFGEIGDWGDEFGQFVTFLSAGIIPEPGQYPIRLIVEDSSGRRSDVFELRINILSEAPTYTISGKTTFYVREANFWEIEAENTQKDPIMRWEIHWGDGTVEIINGGPRNRIFIHHLYTSTGTPEFTVKTLSFFGDEREFSLKFNVLAKPAATMSLASFSIDEPMDMVSSSASLTDGILPTIFPSTDQTPKAAYQRFWEEVNLESSLSIDGEAACDIATLALYEQAADRVLADWTDFDDVLTARKKGGLFDF